ncbi:hypothetical protein GM415_07205 [Pseudodesulfovibrio cashew]|uniref:DUF3887 domain-containing protein n=1 Tax=Pseudodesulfovibrio cashew TaxID=2678688 RepID=A0A6I6JCV0_9BACT|nr:hypothetical protein [Pseudodesulfovibrio cashew]QGY39921.1 hypothetical protein GM415_07205 [Pseudodesulfovibrio cashew]
MKWILTITAFILMASSAAIAANSGTPANWTEATPESMAEAGFDLMLKGEYIKMAETWFDDFDSSQMDPDKLELAKRQYVTQMPMVGKCIRYELAARKEYGKSVVKLTYIVFAEKTPLFFTFLYCKPDQNWTALNISFSDKWADLDK